jgi:hypothetical protein
VGTRQYGDGASAGKKQSKSAKVAETTSGSLGLRLGGMQVYQVPYPPRYRYLLAVLRIRIHIRIRLSQVRDPDPSIIK